MVVENKNILWQQRAKKLCSLKNIDIGELSAHLNILKNKKGEFDFSKCQSILNICDYFEITIEDFLTGNLDYEWIKNPILPAIYQQSLGSTVRTSLPALRYAQLLGGPAYKSFILKKLKVPKDFIANPDTKVSIKLLSDILATMVARRSFSYHDFIKMGHNIFTIKENRSFAKYFANATSEMDLFEKLFNEYIVKYETNFNYTIAKKRACSIVVEVTTRDERAEEFQSHIIDNFYVSLYRHSTCAAHLYYIRPTPAQTKVLTTVHQGDATESFEIFW
ncbi:MAG: hypothetical protein ISR65_15490 [Bacteriovoracaceae bacterium]|nr:hypothetical protein [Bacteriovoracaceae bacterium]